MISRKKFLDLAALRRDAKMCVEALSDPPVRAARQIQRRPHLPENFQRRLAQRFHPDAASVNESAVYVKQIEHGVGNTLDCKQDS